MGRNTPVEPLFDGSDVRGPPSLIGSFIKTSYNEGGDEKLSKKQKRMTKFLRAKDDANCIGLCAVTESKK